MIVGIIVTVGVVGCAHVYVCVCALILEEAVVEMKKTECSCYFIKYISELFEEVSKMFVCSVCVPCVCA